MPNTQVPGAQEARTSAATESRRYEIAPFSSTCPTCMVEQFQHGFSPATLLQLLGGGHPIDAYCVICDYFWPISTSERDVLARQLTKRMA